MTSHSGRWWFSLRTSILVVAVLCFTFACIANILHVHFAERQIALEIHDAGGYVEQTLFGMVPPHAPERWNGGFKWLKRVVYVTLSGTDIDDERLPRLGLDRFEHLYGLSLGYNATYGIDGPKREELPVPITNNGLAKLPAFPKLHYLNLWDLPIGDIALKGLARKYPRLENINLAGTNVTDLGLAELAKLQDLKHLDLRRTSVTDSGLIHLAELKNLQTLRLSETFVAGPGLEHITGLSELVELDLRETSVSDEHMRHLSRLQRLRRLILSGTGIGDEGVRQLAILHELNNLGLRDTAVTDAGVKYLVHLPRLNMVELTGTSVTDAGLSELAKMPNMRHVSLDGTSVTMIGVEDFLRRKPDGSVSYNRIRFATDLEDES